MRLPRCWARPDAASPPPAVYPAIRNFMVGEVGEQASGGVAAAAGRDRSTEVAPTLAVASTEEQ
jgi:hypothetical protein